MKFSKILVTIIIAMNVAFTTVILLIFNRTGHEPSALVYAWFAFTTGELWALAIIKRKETKGEHPEDAHSAKHAKQPEAEHPTDMDHGNNSQHRQSSQYRPK